MVNGVADGYFFNFMKKAGNEFRKSSSNATYAYEKSRNEVFDATLKSK